MVTDDRILMLLKQKSVRCTLRKQPQDLTQWWYDALKVYSNLWTRPDKDAFPVRPLLTDIYTVLKFVALPNNPERKKAKIDEKWPGIMERVNAL